MKLYATICDGGIRFEDTQKLSQTIEKLEGSRVTVEIKKRSKNRSLPQNDYYHGVVVKILSDETGFTPEEMHEVLKYKFLLRDTDGDFPYVKSTTSLTTGEFEEYLRQIRMWASADLQTYIPGPNEDLSMF